jgi:isoquinoline 1-oxidoreductase
MSEFVFEPERYELSESPAPPFDLPRRDFFKALGAGIAVFIFCPRQASAQESGSGSRAPRDSQPKDLSAWLHIGESGDVTVFCGKAEVGQNIRTSLTQAVAEELRVAPSSVRLVLGDTDLTPYDMGTFGSRTTPFMAPLVRRAAATARAALLELAARKWQTGSKPLVASDGRITDPASGRSLPYPELARGEALAKAVVGDVPLTPATEWKVAGRDLPKINGPDFVTGRHRYTADLALDGMLHGKVLRPPSLGATLQGLDDSAARAMPGVTVVRDGSFVGVAAPSGRAAAQALALLKAEWKTGEQISRQEIFDHLKKTAQPGEGGEHAGSVEAALAQSEHRLEATYTVEYIAHAPLEPRAALAEWRNGKLTVWTGTQRPFGVRTELAEAFRLPEESVRVIVPDTGSGYGGKHTGDAAIEAARLARAAGKPVRLVWTREEEFTWAYFRPAGVIEVRAGARADGTLTAWEFHNYNSGAAALGTPYEVSNRRLEFHRADSPLRQGSYRALAANANCFAREAHMSELAHAVKMDPLEFRLKNLKDERLRAALEAVAKSIGWGRARTQGRGLGIACGFEKGGRVATAVEIETRRAAREIAVARVVTAFDGGAVVNPNGLKNQIEGCLVIALGGALFEAVEFADGRIVNDRFSRYRVPRFSDVPPMEVLLLDRRDQPSAGAGETPMIALAPAIAGAVFDATRVRLRSLPLLPGGVLPHTR